MHGSATHSTGKERDSESGNDYFGARYYASSMGRFMSPDWSAKVEPVPYAKLDNPQSLNLYAYVWNNPLLRVDADGHAPLSWGGFRPCSDGNGCMDGVLQAQVAKITQQLNQLLQALDKVAMAAEQQALDLTRETLNGKGYHEFGGVIMRRDSDGHLVYTKPVKGEERQVNIDKIHVSKGFTVLAEYHTHPHADSTGIPGPSPGDIYRLRTPELASRYGYVGDTYTNQVYRYTQMEPVKGPFDTGVYGTLIGTVKP